MPTREYETEKDDRHEDDEYPHHDNQSKLVCTCKPSCSSACKGTCGCKKCKEAYNDFLSVER